MGAKTIMDLIDEAEIPCRTDPDLWFAESPEDVEFAKTLCGGCPIQKGLPGPRARARGAVGRLGWRTDPQGDRRSP
ncbi:hypothetical protein GCM10020219_089640 [Nonomuraea dietziae]